MDPRPKPTPYSEVISPSIIGFVLGLILTPILALSGVLFTQATTTAIFTPLMFLMLIDSAIILPLAIYWRVTSYADMRDDIKILAKRYHAGWTIYYFMLIFLVPFALLYGLPRSGYQYTVYTILWLIIFLDGLIAMYLFIRMRAMGIAKKYVIAYALQILSMAWYFNWLAPMVYFSFYAIT